MRMRHQSENTRETEAPERQRLPTRAFHPEARSHNPTPRLLKSHIALNNTQQWLA